MAQGFDAPPTLEGSGAEHRRAVTSSRPRGFLSPRTGGTEGGVKTIEERLGEKGGAFFNGKEGRDDFRKTSFWPKGDGGIRKISPQYFLEKILLVFERTFKVLQHLMFRILLGKISVFQ